MPELPEVETVVRSLQRSVIGRRIASVHHLRQDIVSPADFPLIERIVGHRVSRVARRGKRIIFQLDNEQFFYIHLGMSGRLTVEKNADPLRNHTHLIAELTRVGNAKAPAQFLHFTDPRRFGGIWWLGTHGDADEMGPEPLTIRSAQLARQLASARRPIKNALLDQTIIAGLGNIYADEALFRAGLHPQRIAKDLTLLETQKLNRSIKHVLRQALRFKGSTLRDYVDADGNKGEFQKRHRVYDRDGKPCRNCKMRIERMVLAGRSAHFCPRCQPAPRPAGGALP